MRETFNNNLYTNFIIPIIFISTILLSRYNESHLLFHTIAELFSVLVGLMMIIIVSYTYQFTKSNFLLYLGIGYFWVSILDLLHMLTFPGISIYIIDAPNVTLTFWLSARLLEAFILFSAIFVNFNIISKSNMFILYMSKMIIEVYNKDEGACFTVRLLKE